MSANSSGASLYAPHPTIANLYVAVTDSTSAAGIDPISFCLFRGNSGAAPTTDANTYHHGCIAQVVDGTGLSVYVNTGTYAAPAWTSIGSLPPGDISLTQGSILVGNSSGVAAATRQYGAVSVQTNGTTVVPLFSNPTGFAGSLTGIYFTSIDNANGTITVSSNGSTVATLTKGSIGSVVGSSISAFAFTGAGSLNVVSSGASANGTITATFITG